ncbi:hypothetical protein NQZ68_001443 [Dissostichus eleginoides]|nr:hypothetical protein NQZ68_001443 [Dissostichus eleginoides]
MGSSLLHNLDFLLISLLSTLCLACCSDSSQTKLLITEPLFSVTGCLTIMQLITMDSPNER